MRKVLILVPILMLSLLVAKAHNEVKQTPIIALADNKLYAVSAEDGSARVLAEPTITEQPIAALRVGSISPDGKQLVYMTQSAPDVSLDKYGSHMYLLTIADGSTEELEPKGGVFDVPMPKGYVSQIDMPTWSLDGQRIYYFRSQYALGKQGDQKPKLLAYYDVNTHKHVLVARFDPTNQMENLQAVKDGMLVRWYKPGFDGPTYSAFYGLDSQSNKPADVSAMYLYGLRDTDGTYYYARLNDFGDVHSLVNVATGDEKPSDVGFYPAAQSLMNGERSMHLFSVQGSISTYYVYDAENYITSIDDQSGFSFALAPDGQSVAYLLFENGSKASIQIMDMNGDVRKLDFEAEQIVWGAIDFVPFLAPG